MNSIDVTLANGHAPRPAAPARPAPAADANRVLLELAQLLESADDADAFFGRFLERAAALTDATAVAVWSHDNGRAPDVIASHHIEQAGLTPGTREWSSH